MATSTTSMPWRSAVLVIVICLLGVLTPSVASAAEQVKLKASFTPDRLGASTTIRFGFNIASTTGGLPAPVTDVQIDLPAGMGLGTTNLGEATCDPVLLFEDGPRGCPANSRMGLGNADVEIPEGTGRISIHAFITIYMGVPKHQHTALLIFAETRTPVVGNFLFPSELLPTTGIYGASIHTKAPLIPTWPEGPLAVIVHMETTLGPSHLTYFMHRHGKIVPYTPKGMAVPERCPRGGFPFHATYHFYDGSIMSATTRVPCPRGD